MKSRGQRSLLRLAGAVLVEALDDGRSPIAVTLQRLHGSAHRPDDLAEEVAQQL